MVTFAPSKKTSISAAQNSVLDRTLVIGRLPILRPGTLKLPRDFCFEVMALAVRSHQPRQ